MRFMITFIGSIHRYPPEFGCLGRLHTHAHTKNFSLEDFILGLKVSLSIKTVNPRPYLGYEKSAQSYLA